MLPLGILAHPILKPLSNARGSREPRRKAKVEPCNFPRDPILGGQCAFPLARVLLEGGQEGRFVVKERRKKQCGGTPCPQ